MKWSVAHLRMIIATALVDHTTAQRIRTVKSVSGDGCSANHWLTTSSTPINLEMRIDGSMTWTPFNGTRLVVQYPDMAPAVDSSRGSLAAKSCRVVLEIEIPARHQAICRGADHSGLMYATTAGWEWRVATDIQFNELQPVFKAVTDGTLESAHSNGKAVGGREQAMPRGFTSCLGNTGVLRVTINERWAISSPSPRTGSAWVAAGDFYSPLESAYLLGWKPC